MSYSTMNYGAGDSACKICHGLGYYRWDVPYGHPQFGRVHDCECRNTNPATGGLHRAWMTDDQIFETLALPSEWVIKSGQEAQANVIMGQVELLRQAPAGGWITLVSDFGTGKSSLMRWMARECVAAGRRTIYCDALKFEQVISFDDERSDYDRKCDIDLLLDAEVLLFDNLDWKRTNTRSGVSYSSEQLTLIGHRRYEGRGRRTTVWAVNNEVWADPPIRALYSRLTEGIVALDRTQGFRAELGQVVG